MKIFGIGLNKTGTVSLHNALLALGYRSLHFAGPEEREKIQQARREGRGLVDYLPEYDAFSDIWSLSKNFALLDEQYPGSKFILTTRGLDGWLRSRRHHVERNIRRKEAGTYHGTFLTVDVDEWTRQYRDHHERVFAHFADRPDDLLVMDIPGGDGYDVLCPFLGRPVLDEPFPWRNRGATPPSAAPSGQIGGWRRRMRRYAARLARR